MTTTDIIYILGLSALPISEIRGSVIYWAANPHLSFWIVYVMAVIANFLPVPFILLLFRPVIKWLKTTKLLGWAARWLEDRAVQKSGKLMKASAIGLFIFVAIPFPTTGAWTGSMIAVLLDMRYKYALPAILAGIMVAGLIMWLLATGLLNLGVIGDIMFPHE